MSPSDPEPKAESSSRDRLPFEPKSRKSSDAKAPGSKATDPKTTPVKSTETPSVKLKPVNKPAATTQVKASKAVESSTASLAIPDSVSRRMARRMAVFCGIPTSLGVSTFFVSYFLVVKEIATLPNSAVVLVSMGFFGLGVVGLTYGVLSASWDEELPGSIVGWSEFFTNLGRMTAAWRSSSKKT
jgi:Photosynthesis affected mutant 68